MSRYSWGLLLGILISSPAYGEQPHLQQTSKNLLSEGTFQSAGQWILKGDVAFDTKVSTEPGSGSMRFRTPWIKDYLYFNDRYGLPSKRKTVPGAIESPLVEVDLGQTITFTAKIRSEAWPSPFFIVEIRGFGKDRTTRQGLSASRQAISAPGEWQEIAVIARIPDSVKFAQVKITKCLGPYEGQPINRTYVGRMANDGADYHGEMWLDDAHLGIGVGFQEPPDAKKLFDGERVRVDALGNFEVKQKGKWKPFFPFCIYADNARPLAVYAQQGFNCPIRETGIKRMKEAKEAGMMFGFDLTAYLRPDRKASYDNTEHLKRKLEEIEQAGVSDHLLFYHWDNENTLDEWAVFEHVTDTIKKWEIEKHGRRQVPIYALNGMEGIARAYRNIIDVTGDYVTYGGGGAEGGGTTSGLIILNNIQGQTIPVTIAQLNRPGENMLPTLYNSLIAGGKGMGFWRDHFSNGGFEKWGQPPIDQLPWWSEFPTITANINQMLPLLREPNWTDWHLTADDDAVNFGTRDYQSEGHVIVSNAKGKPVTVRFTIHGLSYKARSVVDFLTNKRLASVTKEAFSVTVPAHGGIVCRFVK